MYTLFIINMKQSNLISYKFIKKTFKLPDEICFIISKFLGKNPKKNKEVRWVRLKYPNEKRLIRVSY